MRAESILRVSGVAASATTTSGLATIASTASGGREAERMSPAAICALPPAASIAERVASASFERMRHGMTRRPPSSGSAFDHDPPAAPGACAWRATLRSIRSISPAYASAVVVASAVASTAIPMSLWVMFVS